MKNIDEYDDIINLPHYVSKKYKQMDISARAAQFAPFAALTGHEEAVRETERLTEKEKILDDNYKSLLDEKIALIENNIGNEPLVSITYFIRDLKKDGGKYVTITDNIRKIDTIERIIILKNKTKINFHDIIDICEEIEVQE